LVDPGLRLGSWGRPEQPLVQPIIARNVGPLERRLLASAFPLSIRQLHRYPACRELFEDLGTDALLVLSTTIYLSPPSLDALSACNSLDAVAFTRVGQQTTILCPTFARLSLPRAAVVVLHEGLHYAGMPERPGDPAARSSSEINRLVENRCGL